MFVLISCTFVQYLGDLRYFLIYINQKYKKKKMLCTINNTKRDPHFSFSFVEITWTTWTMEQIATFKIKIT